MTAFSSVMQWILGGILIFSSLGVILAKKPVRASISFLVTLLTLAVFYLQLSAEFIAVMQVLVYAGAILVIFMFVIILFQDAYLKIDQTEPRSEKPFLIAAAGSFILALIFLGTQFLGIMSSPKVPAVFGTVEQIGMSLYLDFFFPFEAVIFLFLIALVGALYIAKKVR